MRFLICFLTIGVLAVGSAQAQSAPAAPTLHDIESSNLDADFSPGEATTNTPAELDEIYAQHDAYLDFEEINRPIGYVVNPLEALNKATGLRLGMANTMLYLQPMGGQSDKYGAAGDFDIMSSWTLLGRNTKDTGRLVTTVEYRYTMGDRPPSVIGREIGTLIPPTNAFNDRGWVVRDAYWVQRLFNARLRILIGRADPSDYVGAHWLQNVNNSFVNRHFSANPAVPFPGHGPMLGVSLRPTDLFYITGGVSNAYSQTIRNEVDTLFNEWDLFSFGEIGLTPSFKGLGSGRYSFGMWHMDSRNLNGLPSDYGLTAIVDQNLGDHFQVFARYAYSDGVLTNVRHLAQAGVGLSGLLGRRDDLTGAAVSLAVARNQATRNETVLEVFHRFQLTKYGQVSFGLQLIADPGNATDNNAEGIFYARFRAAF